MKLRKAGLHKNSYMQNTPAAPLRLSSQPESESGTEDATYRLLNGVLVPINISAEAVSGL
jgi:hypothetical protein